MGRIYSNLDTLALPVPVRFVAVTGHLQGEFHLHILERLCEAIAVARAEGKYKGRRPTLSQTRVSEIRRRASADEKKAALAREFGVSRETLYCCLRNKAD